MELYIDNRQDDVPITEELEQLVAHAIETAVAYEGIEGDVAVSVSFVGDDEIRELNRDYRGVDRTTDVLSFPLEQEFDLPMVNLGDVVINTRRVLEQAAELGHSNAREVTYLTVHSVLHLLGYDHMNEDDKSVMRREEKAIMEQLL
ncbi:rRNA maturation RNase YbeY [Peptoniphilus equinus]|uniref:Endoribonuclease YbeY n=1 Tax=Peptoniphilus equinus TaxID=3016343 RepID=A0ABY7QUC1_9FIRM|nr:rRNA maturation RNase YbeY [Peptoniphilus equinus]WBW50376.1 rRNA maturation RNase YbeY [Peptoniphilus equinus]